MLRAIGRDKKGRPALIVGLTEENWRSLETTAIPIDASDMGIEATLIIFGGKDLGSLKAKLVELGLADRSILDVPDPSPNEGEWWRPEGDRPSKDDSSH